MAMLWYNVTNDSYSYVDDKCYGLWEEPFSLSTFNPAHLWFRTNPLQHPTRDPQSLPCLRLTYQHLGKKMENGVMIITEKDSLFHEEWEYMHNARWDLPYGHSWVYPEGCGLNYVCEGNGGYCPHPHPPLAVAPLVYEGERPIGTRPVPPRRRKAEKRRASNSIQELEYNASKQESSCPNCIDKVIINGRDSHMHTRKSRDTPVDDNCINGAYCQSYNNVYDWNGNCEEYGRRYAASTVNGNLCEGVDRGEIGWGGVELRKERGGECRVEVEAGGASAAAGVIGCVQVPSSGGTRGCLPGGCAAPPFSPPLPPPRSRRPPPPPPPPPHSSSGAPHRPRTLWRFLSCWMVKAKTMADWDVDLSSPTYCAACAVMDTRTDDCCSSAWDTAEAWWGSFVCPSWKCDGGGCVAEVIQETPKPSFTLPKPPVGPSPFGLPLFRKLEQSLHLPKWKTSKFSLSQYKSCLNVPKFKSFKAPVGLVPKWVHSSTSLKSMISKWRKPKVSLSVPKASLGLRSVRIRMKLLKRLSPRRVSTINIKNLPTTLTGLTSKIQRPKQTTFRHKDRTYGRYFPFLRLKTRLKLLRTFVTDHIFR